MWRQHQELGLQVSEVGKSDGVRVPMVEEETEAGVVADGLDSNSMPFRSSLSSVHLAHLDRGQRAGVLRIGGFQRQSCQLLQQTTGRVYLEVVQVHVTQEGVQLARPGLAEKPDGDSGYALDGGDQHLGATR